MRIPARLTPGEMKTYQILAPQNTHFRSATCEEVQCWGYLKGWQTVVDERTELGMGQAYYIRKQSGRSFKEFKDENGLTVFRFKKGQNCFGSGDHRIRIDRPEIYVVKDGDWRGNPRGTDPFFHRHPDDFVDDFANHQDKLKTRLERG